MLKANLWYFEIIFEWFFSKSPLHGSKGTPLGTQEEFLFPPSWNLSIRRKIKIKFKFLRTFFDDRPNSIRFPTELNKVFRIVTEKLEIGKKKTHRYRSLIIDEKFNEKFCEVYRKGEADSCRPLASSHNPETIRFSREVEKPPSSGKISNAGCSFLAKSNSPIDGGRPLRGGGGSIVTLESWRGKENNDRKNARELMGS